MHADAASLDELRRRAAKFMQLEELHEFRNQAQAERAVRRRTTRNDREGLGLDEETPSRTTVALGFPGTHSSMPIEGKPYKKFLAWSCYHLQEGL